MYIGIAIISITINITRLKTAQSVTLKMNNTKRMTINAKNNAMNIDPNSLKSFFMFQK
jgi:hypothetical protein